MTTQKWAGDSWGCEKKENGSFVLGHLCFFVFVDTHAASYSSKWSIRVDKEFTDHVF